MQKRLFALLLPLALICTPALAMEPTPDVARKTSTPIVQTGGKSPDQPGTNTPTGGQDGFQKQPVKPSSGPLKPSRVVKSAAQKVNQGSQVRR